MRKSNTWQNGFLREIAVCEVELVLGLLQKTKGECVELHLSVGIVMMVFTEI